ncbi:hypothetical protein IAT38_001209 [Cryptococcus sp. DSM 104549]
MRHKIPQHGHQATHQPTFDAHPTSSNSLPFPIPQRPSRRSASPHSPSPNSGAYTDTDHLLTNILSGRRPAAPKTSTALSSTPPFGQFPHIPPEIHDRITELAIEAVPPEDVEWRLNWLMQHKHRWLDVARPLYESVKLSADNVHGFLGGELGAALFDAPGLTADERKAAQGKPLGATGLSLVQRKLGLLSLVKVVTFLDMKSVEVVVEVVRKMRQWPEWDSSPMYLFSELKWAFLSEELLLEVGQWDQNGYGQDVVYHIFCDLGFALPSSASACFHIPNESELRELGGDGYIFGGVIFHVAAKQWETRNLKEEAGDIIDAVADGGDLAGLEQVVVHNAHTCFLPAPVMARRLSLYFGDFEVQGLACIHDTLEECIGRFLYLTFTL